LAWPGITGNRLPARRYKTDIGHAANIDHRDRLQKARRGRKRAMKHGHQRRPLPALRDIGSAKVEGNLDPEFRREIRAVADLHGETGARAGAKRSAHENR